MSGYRRGMLESAAKDPLYERIEKLEAECQRQRDRLADALETIMAGRFVLDEVPGTDEWLQDPEAPKQPGGMLYIKSVEIINDAEAALASVRGE